MRSVTLATDSRVIIQNVHLTESILERLRGLLGKDNLDRDEAMWIKPCSSIHTFFMRFSIDVFFLDRNMQVVDIRRDINPWNCVVGAKGSFSVLETVKGAIPESIIAIGDQLRIA